MSAFTVARLLAAAALASAAAFAVPAASHASTAPARLFVPPPSAGAPQQILQLTLARDLADAMLLGRMELQPRAVWLDGGSPQQVRRQVQTTMLEAAIERALPVFVAYDLPFRDCGQYSAGGARDTASYLAWIKGVAAGIGGAPADVILEPDGLGLVPNEGCTPSAADLAAAGLTIAQAEQARYDQLNGAVDLLKAHGSTKVYLDATHPGWLNVGDAAQRLVRAGVQRADGFFLDVSNYQYTVNSELYGTWISDCVAESGYSASFDFSSCPNQYWNGGPDGTRIASLLGAWTGVALSAYGQWSDDSSDPSLNTSGITARYAGVGGGPHFVIDTSRNGNGPWNWAAAGYPDAATAQDWCNPPGRGLGARPAQSPDPANPLLDAYLWVKTPGQSDGSCTRGTAGPGDPEWGGIADPAAGAWFPQQALQLAQLATPPLG